VPAGKERRFLWPVGTDLKDALPGETGRDVPDPVAELWGSASRSSSSSQWPRRRVQAVRSAAMFDAMTEPVVTCQDWREVVGDARAGLAASGLIAGDTLSRRIPHS
jgi:hypothetical protein